MITYPNTKINLGLHVRFKREDGFHEIDSVFYPVQWCDALEICKADSGVSSSFSGLKIGGESKDNLIEKAFHLMALDHNLSGMTYHLDKKIPMGAGIGGGSSDAAFAIQMINECFDLNLKSKELNHYAAQLGSDINFFLENKPARCFGRGELVEPIDFSLKGMYIALINPNIHISTKDAYSDVYKEDRLIDFDRMKKEGVHSWKEFLVNDFEHSVFKIAPEIKGLKESLYNQGAIYASMTGSGSTVYGLFETRPDIKTSYDQLWVGELG